MIVSLLCETRVYSMLNDMDDEDGVDESCRQHKMRAPLRSIEEMQKRRYHLKNSLHFVVTPESWIKKLEFLEGH